MGLKTIGSTGTADGGTMLSWCTFDDTTGHPRLTINDIINSYNKYYGSGYTMSSDFWNSSSYPAFVAVKNYTELKAPENKCTGWFMVTAGQYYAVLNNLGGGMPSNWAFGAYVDNGPTITAKVNKALSKAGINNYTDFCQLPIKVLNGDNIYCEWTSSEANTASCVVFYCGYWRNNIIGSIAAGFNSTSNRYRYPELVRPFLAF